MSSSGAKGTPLPVLHDEVVMDEWGIEKESLSFGALIGNGAFGRVFRGEYLGTEVAIKEIYDPSNSDTKKYVEREIHTLMGVRHPNILQFMGVCLDDDKLHIVTEYISHGSVGQLLADKHTKLPWKVYMHARHVMHRDLKAANLMVDASKRIKVCDFGLARPVDSAATMMSLCGTDPWMAPEGTGVPMPNTAVIVGAPYDLKADVFSFGIIILEVLTRMSPENNLFRRVMPYFHLDKDHINTLFPDDVPKELVAIAFDCCSDDPRSRPLFPVILSRLLAVLQQIPGQLEFVLPAPRTMPEPESTSLEEERVSHPSLSLDVEAANTQVSATAGMSVDAQLLAAAGNGDLQSMKQAYDLGASVRVTDNGNTALYLASRSGSVEVLRFLIDHGATIFEKGQSNRTPLHKAVIHKSLEVMRVLLAEGARKDVQDEGMDSAIRFIDFQDQNGLTALHLAAGFGHVEEARLLLQYGADSTITDDRGVTPQEMALSPEIWTQMTLIKLHDSAGNGDASGCLAEIQRGVNIDQRDLRSGETALFQAARNGHVEVAQLLLRNGADIKATDIQGRTALHKSVVHGRAGSVLALVEFGCDINCQDNSGLSPLHLASGFGRLEVARLLIAHGAKPDLKDNESKTPEDFAHTAEVATIFKDINNATHHSQLDQAALEAEVWGDSDVPVPVSSNQTIVGNYALGRMLGQGAFGEVRLGIHKPTGAEVAVKIVEKRRLDGTSPLEKFVHHKTLAREVHMLKLLRHPHVLQLYELVETEEVVHFVTEYVPGGELFDYIVSQPANRVGEEQARRLFRQILSAVHYCHNKGVVHRDLKPENILLDTDLSVKLIDFGLANTFAPRQSLETHCGSPEYLPPEMLKPGAYAGMPVDVWALGVVLYTMCTGCMPFVGETLDDLRAEVSQGYPRFNFVSAVLDSLFARMLDPNADSRANLSEVAEHAWVNEGYDYSPLDSRAAEQKTLERPMVDPKLLNATAVALKLTAEQKQKVQADVTNGTQNSETATYHLIAKLNDKDPSSVSRILASPIPSPTPSATPSNVSNGASPSTTPRKAKRRPSISAAIGGLFRRDSKQQLTAPSGLRVAEREGPFFSSGTTSNLAAGDLLIQLNTALASLNVKNRPTGMLFTNKFCRRCELPRAASGSSQPLRFLVEIVQLPSTDLRGIAFRRVSGTVWLYKSTCEKVLNLLNLS